jgi:hypothetical protein
MLPCASTPADHFAREFGEHTPNVEQPDDCDDIREALPAETLDPIEHCPGCACAECALDEEWLNTDPHKGRPEAYSLDEAAAYYEHESRWLTGLVLVDREVLLGSGFVWA